MKVVCMIRGCRVKRDEVWKHFLKLGICFEGTIIWLTRSWSRVCTVEEVLFFSKFILPGCVGLKRCMELVRVRFQYAVYDSSIKSRRSRLFFLLSCSLLIGLGQV